jgi:uncharacterized protein with PQ loop repeat
MTIKKSKQINHLRVIVRGQKLSVDKLVYVALITPFMALPQLWLIVQGKAAGVSLITWATFLIIAVVWLLYGLKHKIRPMILVQSAWIVIDSAIVVGLLMQR